MEKVRYYVGIPNPDNSMRHDYATCHTNNSPSFVRMRRQARWFETAIEAYQWWDENKGCFERFKEKNPSYSWDNLAIVKRVEYEEPIAFLK